MGIAGGRRSIRRFVFGVSLLALLAGCAVGPHAVATPSATGTRVGLPSPTATRAGATATTARTLDQRVDDYISHMSLAQQIGDTLMLAVYANSYNGNLDQALSQWHLGSAIVFPNYNGGPLMPTTLSGMEQLIQALQSHADEPLLLATDEEGGLVDRLSFYYGSTPSPQQLAASGNTQQVYAQAQTDAQRMRAMGLNLDFAPLADVYQGGGIDQSRTFGTTVQSVTT
ncbi:MAG TPA: glycoside hydrolase family 3 N-terminal domain-containing protein, partial [Ktedonobacterales bacterium]